MRSIHAGGRGTGRTLRWQAPDSTHGHAPSPQQPACRCRGSVGHARGPAAANAPPNQRVLPLQGVTDVGAVSQATNLQSLSLAFNALATLAGLAPLTRLRSLNVSHNSLASVKGLVPLTDLTTLNASHNKVRVPACLPACLPACRDPRDVCVGRPPLPNTHRHAQLPCTQHAAHAAARP